MGKFRVKKDDMVSFFFYGNRRNELEFFEGDVGMISDNGEVHRKKIKDKMFYKLLR
jgi:hypothetical protein